jgi:L-alanine-DL-glutamate epimerase-like enolase superfamily enzyme
VTRIRDVRVELFERPLGHSTAAPRFATGGGVAHQALVSIRTEEGVVGECLFGGSGRAAVELLAAEALFLGQQLVERSSADREWLWSQLPHYVHYERARRQSWAPVDVALWDLAGKEAGLPVCALLGTVRDELPLYISSAYHERPEAYADEAVAWRERGVTAYKPHPGGRPAAEAIALTQLVRDAVGDGLDLILDASLFYGFEDALAIGRHVERLGYLWLEDPMPWAQEQALAELARRLDVPLAGTDFVAADFADLASRARRDPGLRILRVGSRDLGVTGLKRATAFAEALGRRCELHIDDGTHMNLANLHVALSAPVCGWFEMVDPFGWVQWGTTERIEPDANGLVRAFAGAGLGVELDRELLDRSRVARRGA